MIPPTIHSEVRSGAERRMFGVIQRAQESDDWVCLHSLGLARHATKRRAEIDFVLLTPDGVFVLEVKGGRVARRDGVWIFTDRFGTEHRKREGPIDQASSAMFALGSAIGAQFHGDPLASVLMGWAVVFPDIQFDSLGCEVATEQVYDVRDRGRPLHVFISDLARYSRERSTKATRGLDRRRMDQLVEFLRGDFDLVPSLTTALDDNQEQLERMTQEQCTVCDAFEREPRVLVDGPAGSGKTLLALESCRREGRRGRRVLFLCYNRPLSKRLESVMAREDCVVRPTVATFHGFCRSVIEASTLAAEFAEVSAAVEQSRLYEEVFPEFAGLALLEGVAVAWDLLVLDEAQDLLTRRNAAVLDALLAGGLDGGRWRFFLDLNNQASIYGRADAEVMGDLRKVSVTHALTLNCRNTREIAVHTEILAAPRRSSVARVDGPPVEFLTYRTTAEWPSMLRKIVRDLELQGVSPARISVLLPRLPSKDLESTMQKLGVRRMRDEDAGDLGSPGATQVTWAPVSGFKGLENDVVILIGVEQVGDPWWEAVTYVGMSRARLRLSVLLTEGCEAARQGRLARALDEAEEGGGVSA